MIIDYKQLSTFEEVGCLKIPYDQEEGLEKSSVHFFGTLAEKRGQQKNRINYYPFGLTFNEYVHDDDPEQNYKYNGKEEQEKTEWLDYGWRNYDASIGRWHCVDKLSEKYYSISNYVYCANNPIIFVDPNGMEIAGDTAAVKRLESEAEQNVANEQKRQRKMQARADRRAAKGKSTDGINRRIARSEFRENQYQSTIDEIGEMRSSTDIVYNVNTNYSSTTSDGNTGYGGTNSNGQTVIDIEVTQAYANAGGLAHELVHGYQFLTGQIDFQSNGSPGVLYDITDEVSAYRRQYAFTNNSNMYNVTASHVRGIKNGNGTKLYSSLPAGPLNINSSRARIEFNWTGKTDMRYNAPYQQVNWGYTPIFNR